MKLIPALLLSASIALVATFPLIAVGIASEGPTAFITLVLEYLHFKARKRLSKNVDKDKIVNGTKWTRFLENKLQKYNLKNEFKNINTKLAHHKYYDGRILLSEDEYKDYYEARGWTVSFENGRVIIR